MKDLEDQLEERIQKFEDDIQRISNRPSTEPRELKPTVIHLGFDACTTDVMVRLTVNSDPRRFENRYDDEDREKGMIAAVTAVMNLAEFRQFFSMVCEVAAIALTDSESIHSTSVKIT